MKRIIALTLIITISFMCVFNIHVKHANASGAENSLYLDTLFETFYSRYPNQTLALDNLKVSMKTYINPDNNYLVCALENNGTYLISVYYSDNKSQKLWYSIDYTDRYGSRYDGISRIPNPTSYYDSNWWRVLYIFATPTTLESSASEYNGDGWATYPYVFNFSNPYYYAYQAYPSKGNLDNYNVFCNRDILKGSGSFAFPANFFDGEAILQFELVVFWLGEKRYLTTGDQLFMSRLDPEKVYYGFHIGTDVGSNEYSFYWDDVINVGHVESFIDYTFSNVSEYGIYAFDITYIDGNYIDFCEETIMDMSTGDSTVGAVASNLPLQIVKAGGSSDTYTDVWNYWYEYINNYPTNSVIPENLGEVLYGVTGTKSYPVEVLAPGSIINDHLSGSGTYLGEGYFQYHFALNNNSAMNYDILDVCVTSEQSLIANFLETNYSIRWWYDDSLNPNYTTVKDVAFMDLFDMYDIILIVSDTEGYIHNSAKNYVYTGDSDLGFQYSSSEISNSYTMKGFAFVTKKALQKQMLFNFNDGITKTYKLMSDYIEKRNLWDLSFLQWTTDLFMQYQSIFGVLSSIDNSISSLNLNFQNILDKLDTLIHNTDEQVHDFWILPLYEFVQTFVPSVQGFTNWIDSIEEFGDEMPELPVVTVPLIPPNLS